MKAKIIKLRKEIKVFFVVYNKKIIFLIIYLTYINIDFFLYNYNYNFIILIKINKILSKINIK